MTTNEHNPSQHGPAPDRSGPITEADLLAAIERPGQDMIASGKIEAMRRDRSALRGLPVERVPEGLLRTALDEALGELDTETLLRFADGEPTSDRLPVSRVVPERFSIVGWLRTHPQQVAFAAAASVVLFVGGFSAMSIRNWLRTSPAPAPPIALEDEAGPGLEAPVEIAAIPAETPPDDVQESQTIADAAPDEPVVIRPAPTLFAAADLLAEGRLMVLARGGSSSKVASSLEPLTLQRIGPDHSWSLSAGMPAAAVSALKLPAIERPAFASGGGPGPRITLAERSAWSAKLNGATPTALAALLDGLRKAGLDVELRELDEPVFIEPGVDPDDVLWWSRPPSSWKLAVAVPVVVETLP